MLRVALLSLLCLLLFGCDAAVCGEISLGGIDRNPDIEKYRGADGRLRLLELCGPDQGAFSLARSDTGITTLVLDTDATGALLSPEASPIPRVVLPAASVVFWSANLVAGKTLTLSQLAGSGLQKKSEAATYEVYGLTAAKLEVLEGPLNHQEEKLIDTVDWSEQWRLRWSFEYGGGVQQWSGEDLVTRRRGTEVGSEPFTPPDPKP